jgi:tRNA modification GTPase
MLAGNERAIISPSPGTTRDVLEAEIEVGGVRLVIRDTAGLRSGGDEIETEGQRRALGAAAGSDLVILLWAADGERPAEVGGGVPVIRVRSKADLGFESEKGWLEVSCHTGAGVEDFEAVLTDCATREVADLGGAVAVAERHRAALARARDALLAADWSLPETAADDVRQALGAAEDLVGAVDDETVLDEVFAGFCVGK